MSITPSGFTGDVRKSVVNSLEYAYGPVLVSLAFCYFFVFSDPAREVVLGFLTDLDQGLFYHSEASANAAELASKIISLTLLSALPAVAYALANFALESAALDRVRRLYGEDAVLDFSQAQDSEEFRDFQRRLNAEREPYEWVVLLVIPLLFSIAYVVGFGFAMTGTEARAVGLGWSPLIWLALAYVPVIGLLIFVIRTDRRLPRFFWVTWTRRAFRTSKGGAGFLRRTLGKLLSLLDRAFMSSIGYLAQGAVIFVALISLVFVIWPQSAVWFGPIGTAVCFVVFAAILTALLTISSLKVAGHVPLILILFGFILATTSLSAALILCVILGLGSYTHKRLQGAWPQVLLSCFVISMIYVGFHAVKGACQTPSGCNFVHGEPIAEQRPDTLQDAWDMFVAAHNARRAAKEEDPKSPEKIRIVAAQGGGLYAAYHTAYFLAAKADRDPEFANTVFAISGVSGGSVGAAVFWAVRASGKCEEGGPTCHRNAVRQILERDFLSPAVAGLLFRDNLDGVFPISMFAPKPIDRGRVMENRFTRQVQNWQQKDDEKLLEQPISGSFKPELGAPLLYFNGTRVDDGRKYVFSPVLRWDDPLGGSASTDRVNDPDHYSSFTLTDDLGNDTDLRISTAMMISARFPAVSPPARLRQRGSDGKPITLQMVDGGYFDNSGIETAHDIIRTLRQRNINPDIELIVLKVALTEDMEQPTMRGFVGAPLSGFFGAWRARIGLSEQRVREATNQPEDTENGKNLPGYLKGVTITPDEISAQTVNFTVSWYLACGTFRNIAKQVDEAVFPKAATEPATCAPPDGQN